MCSLPAGSPSEGPMKKRLGQTLLLFGVLVLGLGCGGLWKDIGWIAQPFYVYAWWGYIFLLDGFCVLKRGQALLSARSRQVPLILLWSTSFWFFFELINARFQNWYYVGVFCPRNLTEALGCGAFAVACFSTVFTGLFETHEALTALGLLERWRGKQRQFPLWVSYAVQLLGALMVTLSIAFPYYLAPLVWGSLTFLLDPWNYRKGARSILRDLEHGDFGLFSRILLAGLVCGLVWESLNFFAPQKWVYTVRGLEGLKLFEMPLAGFLGFPALAADSFAAYSLVSYLFHGNQTWESAADLSYRLSPRRRLPWRVFIALLPVHLGFWGGVNVLITQVNLGSVELGLEDLSTLSASGRGALASAGIHRPIQFLREAKDASRTEELRRLLRYSCEDFQRLLDEARLYTFKGIGKDHGVLLQRAGILRVDDLRGQSPEALHAKILALAGKGWFPPPRIDMVRGWVLDAK